MTIASDNVDPEMVAVPRRWDIGFIRRFMLVFWLLSSVFDYATFGVLLLILHASPAEFRTGWFIESVASAALVVLVIRTRRPLFRSAPSWKLLTATVLVVAVVVIIPFTPPARSAGAYPHPGRLLRCLGGYPRLLCTGGGGSEMAVLSGIRTAGCFPGQPAGSSARTI